jgi:inward rectifier potassium channel
MEVANKNSRPIRVTQGAFESSKIGATRFDLREPYYIAISSSWPLFGLIVLTLLSLLVALFALLYLAQPGSIEGVGNIWIRAFFFSLQMISTAGFGNAAPATPYSYFIAAIERVVGLAIIPTLTGLMLIRFSRSRSGIMFADQAVVSIRNGRPTLMVRIANCKSIMLADAKVRMSIMLKDVDECGDVWHRYYDLKLVRDTLPQFGLTWTLIHWIDEKSPLHNLTSESLAGSLGRVVLLVGARDMRVGRPVEDVKDYDSSRILFGKHYRNILTQEPDGRSSVDLRRLSEIESDPPEVIARDRTDSVV